MKIPHQTFLIATFVSCIYSNSLFSQSSFAPFQAITTGSYPEVVAIADLNNDGLNDIALATSFYFDPLNDFKLFLFLQNGSGGLQPPLKYPYTNSNAAYVSSITSGDMNNDGRDDLVLGFGDSIGIFFQNTSGQLNPVVSYYSGKSVDGIKAGDLNNDGLMDVVVAHWNDPFINVFYQSATGFNAVAYPCPQSGYDEIDIGDVNGDGLNDVVYMRGQFASGLNVFIQNASGLLNTYIGYVPASSPFINLAGIAIGDLNNDGKNDVAATGYHNSPNARVVLWFQNPSTGLLISQPQLISYDCPEPIEISDLNCDGKNEMIIGNGGWMKATVFEQNSSGQYAGYTSHNLPYASHYKPQGLAIGDVNNDGSKDVALADYNNGLVLLINNAVVPGITITANSVSGGSTICVGQAVTLNANGATNYSWAPSAGLNTTSGGAVIATPSTTTSYTVTGVNACGKIFSAVLMVNVLPFPTASISANSTVCAGESITLTASGGGNYLWSTGATTSAIVVSPYLNSTYSVSVSNGICSDDTFSVVTVNANPQALTSGNTTIYSGQSITLTVSGGTTYLWDTGETTITISVTPAQSTTYCVTVADTNNCTDTACVFVEVKSPCDTAGTFYFPNALSPNGDGENDSLQIYYRNMDCIKEIHLIIYDRWGENIYETRDPLFHWDGRCEGSDLGSKIFTFSLYVEFTDGKTINRRGNISLLR